MQMSLFWGFYVLCDESNISLPCIPEGLMRFKEMCGFEEMCFSLQQKRESLQRGVGNVCSNGCIFI